jgi:hypothetical protein
MRRTSENKINTVSDLNEIRARFSGAKSFLLDELEREGLRFGADVSAVVENRVVSTGKNDIGTPFSPYSTKRAPAYLYLGKSRNNRGEGAIKQRIKKKEGVSYREFRELNGLNADKKNFEFTGEMWQGFGVVSSRKIAAGVIEVTIGAKNARTSALLTKHEKAEGRSIIKPSAAEVQAAAAGILSRLKKAANV